MLQEKEEQLLKKRMIELAGLCYQRDIQTSTGFLSLNEQTIFHSIEKTLPPVRTCLTGGFEGAERKLSLPGTHNGAPHLRDLPQGGCDGADHTEDGAREWKRCITAS